MKMENNLGKNIGIVCIIIISAALIFFLWNDAQERREQSKKIQAYKEERYPLERRIRELESEMSEVKEDYKVGEDETEKYVALIVTQSERNLYEEIYPLFEEYEITGTFVIERDGLPGEEGQISEEEYQALVDTGWEAAIGGDPEEDLSLWREETQKVLDQLEERGLERPDSYVFLEEVSSEQRESFLEILDELGMTSVVFPEQKEEMISETYTEGQTLTLGSLSYIEDTTYVKGILDSMPGGCMAAVTTRYISEGAEDAERDCSIEKYKRLLDYLEEQKENMVITGPAGIKEAKEKAKQTEESQREAYEQAVKDLESEEEECRKKLDEINFPDL